MMRPSNPGHVPTEHEIIEQVESRIDASLPNLVSACMPGPRWQQFLSAEEALLSCSEAHYGCDQCLRLDECCLKWERQCGT